MVSVVIPVFNESDIIGGCLISLWAQSYKDLEIIVVDDGSKDNPEIKIVKLGLKRKIKLFRQDHQGPGAARNFGAGKARGEILVFVDADMVFDKNFIKDIIAPIEKDKSYGTFSKEEYLLNKNNEWAIFWNINRYLINGWKLDKEVFRRILPTDYPNSQKVFRAIKKEYFDRVSGFDETGYTDDWTLSSKLGKDAILADGAICYHKNPDNPKEIFIQARWIGYNRFITGSIFRRLFNILRYSIPVSILIGIIISIKFLNLKFILFKIIYDLGVWESVVSSFFSGKKYK